LAPTIAAIWGAQLSVLVYALTPLARWCCRHAAAPSAGLHMVDLPLVVTVYFALAGATHSGNADGRGMGS